MISAHHIARAADNAPTVTYSGAAASVALWGLNVSEICVIISTTVSVLGLVLQIWLATRRLKRLEQGERTTRRVVSAVAKSHRVVAARVDNIEKSGDQSGTT